MGEGSPASGQVHVEPGTGMLLFHSSAASATVYITMVAHMSFNDAAYQAWLHANCVRMYDQVFGGSSTQYVAGADVVIGPGYVGTDGLLYQSSPDAWATNATLFITSAATTGNLATVQRSGDVTPKRSMPPNDKIWAGRGGEVTWSGDEDPAYKLVTDDLQQFLGTSDHTGLILILNPNVPVTRFAE